MATCIGALSANFVRDCSYRPKANLDNTVYLANTSDIDKSTSQLSDSGLTVSSLVLNDGASVYSAEGAGKYPQGSIELVKGDNGNAWKHGLTLRILYYGEDQRAQVQEMVDNGRITAIIKKKDSGLAGELTYEVLGYESGMAVQTVTWNSNENDGVVEIALQTEEDELEGTDRKIFMDTDLATTTAWIAANVAA